MFWIQIRELSQTPLPNAMGPFESLDEAENYAGQLQPGKYTIMGDGGKILSVVTIEAPKPSIARTK